MKILDCKGLACPKPVINTKKAIETIDGDALKVIVDNEVAKENVSKFLSGQGIKFHITQEGDNYHIETEGVRTKEVERNLNTDLSDEVILFSKNVFGTGDDKLGDALMKSFMFALSESKIPKTMIFVNSGVKLTTGGSEVIDIIKELEAKGVEVLSCGTCLDFYELTDKLNVGGVTNMYTIIEHLQNSRKVINL